MFDFSGRIVRTIAVKSGNLIQINTDGLKAGSYFIRLIENGKTIEQVSFMKH
ncbi:MAG: T9SS type A sorting domain-containing protein [Chitinophagaceae bacterium]